MLIEGRVLYFSSVSWEWIKQRPHFIVEGLAKAGYEVLFFARHPIGRGRSRRKRRIATNLELQECGVLPGALRFSVIDKLNALWIRQLIEWRAYDVVILTEPRQLLCLPKWYRGMVIYDCMDRQNDFYRGNVQQRVVDLEQKLCQRVNHVIVSAQELKHFIETQYHMPSNMISIVYNGLVENFLTEAERIKGNIWPQRDIVYVGTIESWLDWNVLIRFAQTHHDRIIELVGPIKCANKRIPKNIIMKGSVPHEQIAEIILSARILLLPFVVNKLTEAVDPIKLYEYIALGKMVVSAYWSELNHFLPNSKILFYHGYEEFEALIDNANNELTEVCNFNYAFLMDNNWGARVKAYIRIIKGNNK